ncbi:substrate-binding domain-containing protein, partial [Amycolatopsis sp. SID8362]|uniref:LacI family DNA-binding transcriptional regulator n=1 Tax=Amycolatopsis sp. SID8362 TaxID=2690346 RepID=UPI0013702664
MLAGTFRDPDREVAYVSTLRAQRAAAILLIGSAFEDRTWERAMAAELEPYRRGGGQVAAVSRHRGLKIDTVQPDNKGGAAALADALVGLGHKRFAVLAGPRRLSTVIDRLAGFTDALAAHGITLHEDDVVEGAFTRDGGYEATKQLLAGRKRKLPTCVFAVTDVMAIGAMTALREEGLSVPGDISVAGFDDIPVVRDLAPALTTVRLPLEELGERAMDLAIKGSGGTRPRTVRLSGEVVLRESTGRPKR